MGERLNEIVEHVRQEKGAFFVARVALRMRFPLGENETPDSPENEEELIQACRALGFDPSDTRAHSS